MTETQTVYEQPTHEVPQNHTEAPSKEEKPTVFKTCPTCGYPVAPLRKDETGTQWYICPEEKCKAVTVQPQEMIVNDYMAEGAWSYSYDDKDGKKHFMHACMM